ncbi:MAG: EutP/PduV family microcompartment system protein [Bifidobacteriaceae bacterium]|jgi:ethanolamine utilization protein EutP|nr:EutP/PduV family microcompartment system protein [Bifidobacteriaceae bacterium]
MKRAILMGMSGCGKTTLIQRLHRDALTYHKTQAVEHHLDFIDTPGEYMEIRHYYRALIVTAADADVIALVQECGTDRTWLPPAFATTFAKPVIGIVSKADLATGPADLDFARDILRRAGAQPVFTVSALAATGLEPLIDYLAGEPDRSGWAPATLGNEPAAQGVAP